MNKKQKEHIDAIIKKVSYEMRAKYERGAAEHSGQLWEVDGIIDMVIEELIDGLVYAYTLKEQLKDIKTGSVEEEK